MESHCPHRAATEPAPESLYHQAEGLGRAAIMKSVLAEPLSIEMEPIYETISPEEVENLQRHFSSEVTSQTALKRWTVQLKDIAEGRFWERVSLDSELENFITDKRLFFWSDAPHSLNEGARSGVIVPMLMANYIYCIERSVAETGRPSYPHSYTYDDVHIADFTEIMERKSFDQMLIALTKGPNGFLGRRSITSEGFDSSHFFYFDKVGATVKKLSAATLKLEDRQAPLSPLDAFKVKDGKVTELSGDYHIAAQAKRVELRKKPPERDYDGADSSGCPFRHAYADAHNVPSQPLVIVAKNFVIDTLRKTAELPAVDSASSASSQDPALA